MSSVCMRDLEILILFQWYYNAEQSPWEKTLTKNVHILICITLVKKEVIKPNLCDCCYNNHFGPYWISVHCSINASSISGVTRYKAGTNKSSNWGQKGNALHWDCVTCKS